jgi:hypothetical protein
MRSTNTGGGSALTSAATASSTSMHTHQTRASHNGFTRREG